MAEARRRAVQRRLEKQIRTVEVDDGVAAGDVEGEGIVEFDTLVNFIGRDACVWQQGCGTDHKPLALRVN